MNRIKLDRRSMFKTTAAAAGLTFLAAEKSPLAAASVTTASDTISASDSNAIVETTFGRVRGYTDGGIQTFKGIPYAGTTAGSARFLPPTKPVPWTGVRSAMQYGAVCPQAVRTGWSNDENAFLFEWDDGQPGEDCLRVNIWTPGLKDNRKRPVLFWLHGGGFAAGSGQELKSYEGKNLARRGDVVVVSVNHRLNLLGYLNLAQFGEKYQNSVNVGMLDVVAALEWVRDNIAEFGGDPGNVTIFGQSGGGAKVSLLMAMPSAKGLFHKAAVQSGSMLRAGSMENSAKMAAGVVAELRLNGSTIDEIQTIGYEKLLGAVEAVETKLNGGRRPAFGAGFGLTPAVDGKILPVHPFDPVAPAMSSQVPMLIGTVLNEASLSAFNPKLETMTEAELKQRVSETQGEKTGQVIEILHKTYPNAKPVELAGLIPSMRARSTAIEQASRKAEQRAAPAYLYLFAWHTPVLDSRPRAFHCSELAFVFDNAVRCAHMTGGGAEARELAGKVSDAWIRFARSSDPNHPGLPRWPAFTPDGVPTMVFNSKCELRNDHDRDARQILAQA